MFWTLIKDNDFENKISKKRKESTIRLKCIWCSESSCPVLTSRHLPSLWSADTVELEGPRIKGWSLTISDMQSKWTSFELHWHWNCAKSQISKILVLRSNLVSRSFVAQSSAKLVLTGWVYVTWYWQHRQLCLTELNWKLMEHLTLNPWVFLATGAVRLATN